MVDGTDVLAVYREARRAIEKARAGGGPTLLECVTLRMEGHAVHDDAFYVPREMHERLGCAPTPSSASAAGFASTRGASPRSATRRSGRGQAPAERRDEAGGGEPAARAGRGPDGVLADPRSSTRRTTSSGLTRIADRLHDPGGDEGPSEKRRGREDLSAGDLGRPARGDAPRRARVRHRRGRRRLRRRFQGHAGLPGRVRRVAGARRAARRDGDRRRLHGRGHDGHAARGRDAVRGLHLLRLGPPGHRRGQAALPRRHADAVRGALPVGRRLLAAGRSTRRTPSRRSPTSRA